MHLDSLADILSYRVDKYRYVLRRTTTQSSKSAMYVATLSLAISRKGNRGNAANEVHVIGFCKWRNDGPGDDDDGLRLVTQVLHT